MDQLQMFKEKKLEILKELDRVCKLAGVNYYLAYGTLLGAVRHKGYIPWDDDIDVFLPWEEFEKLLQNKNLFKENYFIQTRTTDPGYTKMKVSLRDSNTAFFANESDNSNINHGILIDLYLLFPYPDNPVKAHALILESYLLRLLYAGKEPVNHGKAAKILSNIILSFYSKERAEKTILRIENRLMHNGGRNYYASYFGDDITPFSCFKFPKHSFDAPIRMQFEDFEASCPSNPNEICRITYGDTYMQFPPEDERVPRHNIKFVDFEKSYKEYKGIYYDVDKEDQNK